MAGSPATTRSSRSPARRAAASPRSSTPSSGPTSRPSAHGGPTTVAADRRRLGRRRRQRAARLARRRHPPRRRQAGLAEPVIDAGAAPRAGPWARPRRDWCCSTCPTSTRASSRTAARPSGCSSSSTSSSGSTDPQKYADARLHDDFVSLLSQHDAVHPGGAQPVRPAVAEAVKAVDATSAAAARGRRRRPSEGARDVDRDRPGHPEFTQRLANAVAGHAASRQRLNSDLSGPRPGCGPASPTPSPRSAARAPSRSTRPLARAAGVPIVLDAVARDYRRRGVRAHGLALRPLDQGFAADPLRRLRLDRTGGRPPIPVEIEGADVRALLGRSSIPCADRLDRLGRRPRHPSLRARGVSAGCRCVGPRPSRTPSTVATAP